MTQATPEKRPAGRPRRLSVDAVIDAACAIGIDRLEMVTLADHLNTGVATLYGYVRNRDHLMQLVAQRMATDSLQALGCGSWQDLLRNHASFCYSNFRSGPELMVGLMEGDNGDEEVTYTQRFVELLVKGGLSQQKAIAAYVAATQIVIGAAVMRLRRQTLEKRVVSDLLLHSIDQAGDYRPALERYIRDCENHPGSNQLMEALD